MNNSVYGKTMENVRNHVDVKLIKKWGGRGGAKSLISRPNFKICTIFSKDFVAIELGLLEIKIDKPIYVGLCVLDLSKILLYEFHYDYILPIYKENNCKLLYTDTDSLIYELRHYDIYKIMKRDAVDRFDTSDYPKNNEFGIPICNNKVVGKMKDEFKSKRAKIFVGLRSKMYCLEVQGGNTIKKVKGIKSNVVKNTITFNHFQSCLFDKKPIYREQRKIISHFHNVYTEKETKLALSSCDDKRYILNDCHDTLPYGHYKIKDIV